ncbi:MAG TPA: hypothetical protein VMS98_09000, partial [Thermoanaerobaculia bacterium]|nr:hypothetical protein [Thermoanaerobaculia bacterium]
MKLAYQSATNELNEIENDAPEFWNGEEVPAGDRLTAAAPRLILKPKEREASIKGGSKAVWAVALKEQRSGG